MKAERTQRKQFILAVSGVKNSGKTTLITKILPFLKAKGLNVAVIKHDGHDFEADVPETDSWNFAKAGADGTLVDRYNYMKLISDGTVLKKSEQFGKYISFFPLGGDVTGLTLEGFKYSNYSKIELIRKGNSAKSVCDSKKLLGIVTDFKKEELKEQKILETEKWEKQIKIFDLNQAGSLAEWIYQLWEEIQKR